MTDDDAPRRHVAWLDATAGISGDMVLGALVDAGVDLARIQAAVDAVIPATVRLEASPVQRAGMRATKVDVHLLVPDQPHRSWPQIRALIEDADLDDAVRGRARHTFAALAEAEARVHGQPVEDVHFHEVGSWDSIADVVGACAGLAAWEPLDLVVSPVALGSGRIATAHGDQAVPAPAVLELLDGWSVHEGGTGELATPTGVALAVGNGGRQGPFPPMAVLAQGVGAGTRDPAGRANVVRLVVGMPSAPLRPAGSSSATEGSGLVETSMTVIEANVDDLDGRVWPAVLEGLLADGASDAWLTPILMKKGRPAYTLSVLCDDALVPRLRDRVLTTTTTLGVRLSPVRRASLPRGWVDVELDGQQVAVKVAHRDGRITHAGPEFDSVRAVAEATGRTVRDVLAGAAAQAVADGVAVGMPVPATLRTTQAHPHRDDERRP